MRPRPLGAPRGVPAGEEVCRRHAGDGEAPAAARAQGTHEHRRLPGEHAPARAHSQVGTRLELVWYSENRTETRFLRETETELGFYFRKPRNSVYFLLSIFREKHKSC